jgi:hypothetical protein
MKTRPTWTLHMRPRPPGVAAPGDTPPGRSAVVAHRGLRWGKACGIEWTDVNLGGAQLTVAQTEDAPASWA